MNDTQDQADPDVLVVVFARTMGLWSLRHVLEPSVSEITFGRDSSNTIVLPDDGISRRHARLERRPDGWWVLDCGSLNGTLVNEERVRNTRLRRGDRLRIGTTIFEIVGAEFERGIVEGSFDPPVDGLTGAYSRRYLAEQIEHELRRVGRPGWRLALVLLDLDRFEQVNDAHGHLAGDQLLREWVSIVQQHVRSGDVLARYSGDQLAWLLPGADISDATALAQQVRASVAAQAFSVEEHTISLTVSVGVAAATEDMRTPDELLGAAVEQLEAAKRGDHG